MRTPLPFPALRRAVAVATLALLASAGPVALDGQDPRPALPFGPGEEMVYRASGRLGRIGTGTMRVDGPEMVDGRRTFVLRFDFRGRVGPARVEDRTRSWLDPATFHALRYTKHERSPVTRADVDVYFDPAGGSWRTAAGETGDLATGEPLDELSFLYFLRTLPLEDGQTLNLRRHYDPERNPVEVRVVGRRRTATPAGEFATVEVEMRVRDPERYRDKGGSIRLFLTDDERRIPVRIESSVPMLGRMVMTLVSHTSGAAGARTSSQRR